MILLGFQLILPEYQFNCMKLRKKLAYMLTLKMLYFAMQFLRKLKVKIISLKNQPRAKQFY